MTPPYSLSYNIIIFHSCSQKCSDKQATDDDGITQNEEYKDNENKTKMNKKEEKEKEKDEKEEEKKTERKSSTYEKESTRSFSGKFCSKLKLYLWIRDNKMMMINKLFVSEMFPKQEEKIF